MKSYSAYTAHQTLVESIEENNDTGFSSEDIACLIETHIEDEWSEAMSGDDFIAATRKRTAERRKNAAKSK